MKYIKLEDICNIITRGYTYAKTDLAENEDQGYTVEQIGFSDINEDGTFKASKKVVLNKKHLYHKYEVNPSDVLLPPTIKTTAKARMLKHEKGKVWLYKGVYSSNIVVIRLEEENQYYTPYTLYKVLNTKEIQERLINEVYSTGNVKAISIEKLRHFKVPIITEELKKEINNSIEYENKLQQAEQNINNLISDIMS